MRRRRKKKRSIEPVPAAHGHVTPPQCREFIPHSSRTNDASVIRCYEAATSVAFVLFPDAGGPTTITTQRTIPASVATRLRLYGFCRLPRRRRPFEGQYRAEQNRLIAPRPPDWGHHCRRVGGAEARRSASWPRARALPQQSVLRPTRASRVQGKTWELAVRSRLKE